MDCILFLYCSCTISFATVTVVIMYTSAWWLTTSFHVHMTAMSHSNSTTSTTYLHAALDLATELKLHYVTVSCDVASRQHQSTLVQIPSLHTLFNNCKWNIFLVMSFSQSKLLSHINRLTYLCKFFWFVAFSTRMSALITYIGSDAASRRNALIRFDIMSFCSI